MYKNELIYFGNAGDKEISIIPKMANRHGMIAGATGTGKTTTVKTIAESFSDAGVPVFIADVKGDLSGIAVAGETEGACAHPANFWDVYGQKGMPLRTTISEMGPMLLARILGLNQTQSDILTIIFKIADDGMYIDEDGELVQGDPLLLIDTKDLRAMISHVSDYADKFSPMYGNMAKTSLAAIIRSLITLEGEGGEYFFGEPALDIRDWFVIDNATGKGVIQILDCQRLIQNPTMYSTFLLWMLSEIYETLPEVGDLPKPKMAFFFDEAHMLFDNASKPLLDKIEQVVKLIRSKGVGIFFITQAPNDIPNGVLAQLNNKIQHALRAYTPAEQKRVKAAAESFRENPEFKTFDVLQELQIGEAIVSVLDENGIPTIAERTKVMLPLSSMKPIDDYTRDTMIKSGNLFIKYQESVDRDSAYEFLVRQGVKIAERAEQVKADELAAKEAAKAEAEAAKAAEKAKAQAEKEEAKAKAAAEKAAQKEVEAKAKAAAKEEAAKAAAKKRAVKSVGNSVVGTVGREVGKTVGGSVGGKFGKTLGGNLGAALGRGIFGTFLK